MGKESVGGSLVKTSLKVGGNGKKSMNREHLSEILVLALPLLMEHTLQTLLGTVDRYFASSLEESAIAAIGVTEIVTNLYLALFMAVNVGVSVLIGQNIGKNDGKQAREVAGQGVILSTFLGVFLGVGTLLFGRNLLLLTGCSEEIFVYALPYFMAVAVPSVFLSVSLTLSACLRGRKDTKTPMILSSFCNILNILLNIVFMKLNLGMFGIGLATSFSRLFLCLGLFAVLMRKKDEMGTEFALIKINMPIWKEIASLGLPAAGEKLAMRLGQLGYSTMILALGTEAYVAHTLAATLENYIYIPIFSFATTTSILVSISYGEGDVEKGNQYVRLLNGMNTLVLGGFSFVFVMFGERLVGLFTESPEVVGDTYVLLVLLACGVPFMGFLNIYTSALQGMGDTKTPFYVTAFGIWGIRFGGGFLVTQVFALGIAGFWMVIVLDCVFRALVLSMAYGKKCRRLGHATVFSEQGLLVAFNGRSGLPPRPTEVPVVRTPPSFVTKRSKRR